MWRVPAPERQAAWSVRTGRMIWNSRKGSLGPGSIPRARMLASGLPLRELKTSVRRLRSLALTGPPLPKMPSTRMAMESEYRTS